MNAILSPTAPHGTLRAIASKSAAHRLLIAAAFADAPTRIRCEQINEDIAATADCLSALGATVTREDPYYTVTPIQKIPTEASLPCRESGSTLRFMLPIAAALGVRTQFMLAGRLPNRPLSPLREVLEENGITLSPTGSNPLCMEGRLTGDRFAVAGNVSSQFISGLLFALALCMEGGRLDVLGRLESAPYVDMTCDALRRFGAEITETADGYTVHTPAHKALQNEVTVEGDWSNAAFPLSAAAIGGEIAMTGLDLSSHQGDREILALLSRFGAEVIADEQYVTVRHRTLRGIDIDASQIPDLVPVLATVASVAEGQTRIFGASRLRLKESDRLVTVREMLSALGASVTETEDGLIIDGKPTLAGGTVSAAGDHRIAMSAAVASVACTSPVTITGAEAVSKSYPAFFADMKALHLDIQNS